MLVACLLLMVSASPADAQRQRSRFGELVREAGSAVEKWDLESAERHYRDALLHADGEGENAEFARHYASHGLARVLGMRGKEDESLRLYDEVIAFYALHPDRYDAEDIADAVHEVAVLLCRLERYDEAAARFERAAAMIDEEYEDDESTLAYRIGVADVWFAQGRIREAAELHVASLRFEEARYGPNNPRHMQDLSIVAELLSLDGDHRGAEAAASRIVAMIDSTYGKRSSYGLYARKRLAYFMMRGGAGDDLFDLQHEIVQLHRDQLGSRHAEVAMYLLDLADTATELRRFEEALLHLTEAESTFHADPNSLPRDFRRVREIRASVYTLMGDEAKAIEALRVAAPAGKPSESPPAQ